VFYFLKKKIIIFYYIFRFLETKQEFFLKPIHVFIFLTNNNKMRKDDIIGQKLFETCKLSEFYLNLVVNCKEEDNESPFQLARAYKQKLYEIVERYDRLLDANKQRQQLSLTFDKQQQQKISTRTSTPNKTPLATPTSATGSINGNNNTIIFNYHTPSAPCTPSTPTTPLFSRSSQSILQRTSSFNQTGRSFIYTHNSTKYQQNKSKQQSQQQQQQSQHSSLSKTSKLLQKYAFLYEDDYDSAEDENELLENNNFYSKNKYNNNKKNAKKTIVSSSSSSLTGLQTAMLNCKLNYETYSNTFSKLNQTNSNDETVEEYNDEDEEEEEDLDNEEDNDDEEEEYTNDLNESQIIEKSYSNLSKDSGVFADSYHSDYSTGLIGIGNHDQTVSSNLVKNGENNNKNNNNSNNDNNNNIRRKKKKKTIKFNDTISTTSTTESNKTIDSTSEDYLEQIENKTINQQDEKQQHQKEQIGPDETTASNQLIWGSITQLVEGATFKDAKSLISSSPIESPKTLVKSNTVINNFEFNTNDDLVSIMNTDDNQAYSLNDSAKASTNSNCSTTTVMRHNISQDNERTNKELKFFNTNSLMNVSMLDNIQATNTHLDFDNMNTSILMFN